MSEEVFQADEGDLVTQYAEECSRLAAEEEEFLGDVAPPTDDDGDEPPSQDFIEQCLAHNERGDGLLFRRVMRGRFVYVKKREKKPWLKWAGHHWQADLMGEHIRAVDEIATMYADAAFALDEPIKEASRLLREAEKQQSIAKAEEDEVQAAEYEAQAKTHAYDVKMLRAKKKRFLDRVNGLRGKARAEKAVWWAHHVERPLAIGGDELDQKPMLLACPNGVINLVSGELEPGRPEDYLLRTISIPYPVDIEQKRILHYLDTGKDSLCPEWEKFLQEIMPIREDKTPDLDVLLFLQKLLGYSCTGSVADHVLPILVGEGRNGKGTLVRIVQGILGDLSWTIKSDLLLEQKTPRNPDAATPSILMLKGRRFVIGSETDKHKYIAAGAVKEFAGGDKLNARGLFDGEEDEIKPTHKLWLQTNNIPLGITKDFALRQRVRIISFPWRYVDDVALEARKEPHNAEFFRLKDNTLEPRLLREVPGILLWLLRGCILWQREGLKAPDKVRADLDDLQFQEDHLEQFLRTCCLQDWEEDREYRQGDEVNLPYPDDPTGRTGWRFVCLRDNVGCRPKYSEGQRDEFWSYVGEGLKPYGEMLFKHFYGNKEKPIPGTYREWIKENVTDKADRIPSQKAVAAELRKKGYRLDAPGGQLKIYGGLQILNWWGEQ